MNLSNLPDKPFTLPELFAHWGIEPKARSVAYSSQVRRELMRAGYMIKRKDGKDVWGKRV